MTVIYKGSQTFSIWINGRNEIQTMEGFGQKSYKNLIANVEKARVTTLPKVIYAFQPGNWSCKCEGHLPENFFRVDNV